MTSRFFTPLDPATGFGYEYDYNIKVTSFEDVLLRHLTNIQGFFNHLSNDFNSTSLFSDLQNSSDDSLSSSDNIKLYLTLLHKHLIDLIITYHSSGTDFDVLTFLKDYISTFETYTKEGSANPYNVKTKMNRWISNLPKESYFTQNDA